MEKELLNELELSKIMGGNLDAIACSALDNDFDIDEIKVNFNGCKTWADCKKVCLQLELATTNSVSGYANVGTSLTAIDSSNRVLQFVR